ncbi:MAG TPA: GGDEF domain-containing protein [Baekduia sp.]|nr:GGDEF domain-containing protein [Baekduia sp.]
MGPEHTERAVPPVSLRAVLAEAPDHYALLDRQLVGQLAGVLFVVGGLMGLSLLIREPPTEHVGGAIGWPLAATVIASAFAFGIAMLRTRHVLPELVLLGIALSGPVMIALLQWLCGPTSSYDALLNLSVMWAGVVLPGPRLLAVMLWATAIASIPLWMSDHFETELLDRKLLGVALLWVLAAACLVWSSRVRAIRRALAAQRQAADELARIDPLTGLGNRRALDEALAAQVAQAGRSGRALSALVGDLDNFKAINDDHGHHVGDRLLRDVADVLRDVVRSPDACFRWGGDEFVVLLPEADRHAAAGVADRVTAAITSRCGAPQGARVGITIGVATLVEGGGGLQLLADADAALLTAKDGARRAS